MDRRDALKSIAAAFTAPFLLHAGDAPAVAETIPLVLDTSKTIVDIVPRVTHGEFILDCTMRGTYCIVCPDGRRSGELQWGGDAETIRREMEKLYPNGGEFEVAQIGVADPVFSRANYGKP